MEHNDSLFKRIKEGIYDMCYIYVREMKNVFHDQGVLLFFIIAPLFYPLIYAWIYNNEVVRDVPVAVVDLEHSHLSREYLRLCDASPDVKIISHCNSLDDAKELVEKQIVSGIILIPNDFQKNLNRMEQSHINVYCDMSLLMAYKAIYMTTMMVSQKMNADIQVMVSGNYTNRENEITTQPLDYEEVPIFNPTGGYGSFIIPGVLILIIQQTLLLGIGLAAGTSRENNRYSDLVPISRHYNGIFRIVLGKTLCYAMIYFVIGAYLTLIVPRIFNFTAIANGQALIGLMVPYILACIFFGMVLSCIIRYRENVILIIIFTSVPLLFMSGVSWPESAIPGFWRSVAWLFPSTFGVRGFVRINTMGATLVDIEQEYKALWIQVCVYFFAACLVYRWQINHAHKHALERISSIKKRVEQAKEKFN